MDVRGLRIGYVPYDVTLVQPGDRRRFCYYARRRGLKPEIARPSETYDVVVVTAGGDISVWNQYARRNTKIIYEQIDSYLAVSKLNPRAIFRGFAKFLVRQNERLLLDYNKGIGEMCRRSDAVICCTLEQKEQIQQFCSNVHIILDFHETVARAVKTDYSRGEVFNFVWEGKPGLTESLLEIREVLERISRRHAIAVHVITDLRYGAYLAGKYVKRNTVDMVQKIFRNVYVYAWNEHLCSRIITACDLALIPLPLGDPLYRGKPENKLLLLWRLGMPVVVSATPAYCRAMNESGVHMACLTVDEWESMLERYMADEDARRNAGQCGRAFVLDRHSEEKKLAQWDNAFASVLNGSRQ